MGRPAASAAGTTRKSGPRRGAKRTRKSIPYGQAHVHATFNNTIVSMTDQQGNVVAWASAGTAGVKGSRQSTPYFARGAATQAAHASREQGMPGVDVFGKRPGPGRVAAIRPIQQSGV